MTSDERTGDRPAAGRFFFDAGVVPEEWAPAFRGVPRSAFLPELIWPFDVDRQVSEAVSRADDAATWQRFAEADVPIVTQWDDGVHAGTAPGRVSTSSASMPSVVAAMLADLDVKPGNRVLEVGTGTGWNAGLLAHRLGDANVTTIEVDAAVASNARTALQSSGLHPEVVVGDGFAGHPAEAPYDRIIATCGLRRIPYAWIEQTSPGGLIVAPWGTHFSHGDAVARMTVMDGAASGRFTRLVEFMKLRAQRLTVRHSDYLPDGDLSMADTSSTTVPGEEFFTGRYTTAPFVMGLRVPGCVQVPAEKRGDTRPIWFYSLTDTSWAVVTFRDGRTNSAVYQAGSRRLWDEVETAFRWWSEQGKPELQRFGLTVDSDGHHAWLDKPSQSWAV